MALSKEDLAHIRHHTEDVWQKLQGKRIFITGGSGFYGRWLVESLLHANDDLRLGCRISLLTRSSSQFREIAPHLAANPALSCVDGDIRDFIFPTGGFDYLVHAAANTAISVDNALGVIDTETAGFKRVFDFATESGVSRVLFVSSGAVYGSKGIHGHIREDAPCTLASTDVESRYGELKRFGELYGVVWARQCGAEVVFARSFSTFGPYQNLSSHFAIATFFRDALSGKDIVVNGDGLEQRSYLYGADLAVWLWKLLIHGRSCVPYNVGSAIPCSIADLARLIAAATSTGSNVLILGGQGRALAPRVYLPNVDRARLELGLEQWIDLEQGVRRTLEWNMNIGNMR